MNWFGSKSLAGRMAVAAVLVACMVACRPALADSSYQSSTQITGGVLMDQMNANPLTAKLTQKMFAPVTITTGVRGNQKVVVRGDTTEIWDLDAQTMTHIDAAKKTYWVATFAQMRQGMKNAMSKMGQTNQTVPQGQTQTSLKTNVQVSVNNTGATQAVNGVNAQEQVVTMTVTVTDPNAPASAAPNGTAYVITADTWVALEDPPELKEIGDFDVRMGKKMMQGADMSGMTAQVNQMSASTSQLLANQPGMTAALLQMGQQMATLKGTRVMTVTSIGGSGGAADSVQNASNNASSAQGSIFSGKVGAVTSMIGAFHKKQPAQQPVPAAAAPSGSSGVLMQMTDQMLNFSQDPIVDSAFQVPAGYKQLPSPYAQMSQ